MTPRFSLWTPVATLLVVLAAGPARTAPVFTATDLMRVQRLDEPDLSPDGQEVVFALTRVDLEGRTKEADLWIVSTTGGEPRRLAAHPASDTRPLFSPDGSRIAFLSARDGTTTQVHVMARTGGPARPVTRLAGGVESYAWIDDARLLVVAKIFPECGADDVCNAKRLAAAGEPSSARAYERLPVRHWDAWDDGRRQHLLVAPLDGGGVSDLTPGPDDAPPFSLSGPDDFAVSPDGAEVCFSRKASEDEAWSTNADVWVVPTAGGQPRRVTDGPGYDGECRYSPDGLLLAWRFQARGGYESDRWQLAVSDRASGEVRHVTPDFDRQVDAFWFSPDGKTIYFTAEDHAQVKVFAVDAGGGAVRTVIAGGSFDGIAVHPSGRFVVGSHSSLARPAELVRFGTDGRGLARLTSFNDEVLAPFDLGDGQSVTYRGAAGKDVQAFVVRPPDFDPSRKHPLLVLVHGGPQGAWNDAWGYRWNPHVFAAAGYVVFMPNPRASTGFGQEFTDDIRDDWGGKAYEDVMKGTDFAQTLPGVDPGRVVAAGASYGGYMVDWIAGHTDRFSALVTHDGVFDLVSMYGSTEELWFPEWEFEGTYWTNPGSYEKWNPREFVTSFKTPTLVIHGERDYRVPLEQSLAMYTALQRQGVPSRLLVFPDENHWVLKPWNSVRWYGEVIGWLDRWVKE